MVVSASKYYLVLLYCTVLYCTVLHCTAPVSEPGEHGVGVLGVAGLPHEVHPHAVLQLHHRQVHAGHQAPADKHEEDEDLEVYCKLL